MVLIRAKNDEITSCEINANTKLINIYAFGECTNLTSITIPDSVKIIGESAFSYCTSLKNVTMSNGITKISNSAFYGCSNLTINCEAESKSDGWDDDWNSSNCPVVWDYGN